jgi:hypothetical protein
VWAEQYFRLSSGFDLRPCPLWSFTSRSGPGNPDAPTGVSGRRDFRSASRDAHDRASILRCRGFYLVRRLGMPETGYIPLAIWTWNSL